MEKMAAIAADLKENVVIVRIDFVSRICYVDTIAPSLGYSKQGLAT